MWSQIKLICLGDAKNVEASVPTSGDGAPYIKSILCDDRRWRHHSRGRALVGAVAAVSRGELEKDEPTPG